MNFIHPGETLPVPPKQVCPDTIGVFPTSPIECILFSILMNQAIGSGALSLSPNALNDDGTKIHQLERDSRITTINKLAGNCIKANCSQPQEIVKHFTAGQDFKP